MFKQLMQSRRFAPLFWCQFFSAFNDNFVRNMLAMLVLFRLGADHAGPLISLAIGLFMLPTLLLSGFAGQLADSRDKAITARRIKFAEIGVQMVAAAGFVTGSTVLLYAALVGLGIISALFSPIKYGILPDHLATRELTAGNALVEAGTFFAILLGIVFGSMAAESESTLGVVAQLMAVALVAWGASRLIPPTGTADQNLKVEVNIFASTVRLVRDLHSDRRLWVGGLATSWFWMIGAVALSLVPVVIKDRVGGDITLEMAINALFAIGIAIGSILAALIAKGRIVLLPVPVAAVLMAALLIDLGLTTGGLGKAVHAIGLLAFAKTGIGIHIALDVVGLAVAGGLYIVPAFAAVQSWAGEARRARVVAAVNIINALFIVGGTLLTSAALHTGAAGLDEPKLLILFGVLTLAAAVYLFRNLPGDFLRDFANLLFRVCFRMEVKGIENLAAAGDRCIVSVNHLSLIDAAVVFSVVDDNVSFAIDTLTAQQWWARPFVRLIHAYPMDPTRPLSTRKAIEDVRSGKRLVIFPEGRLTVTGALMKVYDGAAMIADRAEAMVVPVRLTGLEQTPFSYLKPDQVRRRWFPKVTVTILPPRRLAVDETLRGRARRQAAGAALYDVMSDLMFLTSDIDRTLMEAIATTARRHGLKRQILEDPIGGKLTARKMLIGAAVLARKVMRFTKPGENVGLLLPNANGAVVTFLAVQAAGRVPAMMNFTGGAANLTAACKAAQVSTILTSRAFVEKGKLDAVIAALSAIVSIRYLEDVRKSVSGPDKLRGFLEAGRQLEKRLPNDPATIVFTSGSEGVPKGVVLSHRNILANCAQVCARTDLGARDIMFNVLPIFHSFGLTGGMVLPLVSGMRLYVYPSPLHYRQIPELIYTSNATVLIGTDTFLNGYSRTASQYDFRSLRYICAGAEPVKAETRRVYMERFGLKLYEGYGVTETGPVLAVNTPMASRNGTVGRFLPKVEHRFEPVPGIEGAGRLFVRGPNIMLGYYRVEKPAVLEPPADGWHDTGDICGVDAQGFVGIKGRVKRFAKIAGEMVSLAAVEQMSAELWPEHAPCVVAMPDTRKGERIVMVTTKPDAQRNEVGPHMKAHGATELMIPSELLIVEAIPLLGSGKVDYVSLNRTVRQRLGLDKAA